MNEKELIGFIENMLEEHDCIIIPNFGGFVVQKEYYKFNAEDNTILPKRRWVAFNQKLKSDDGFLSHELAIHLQINNKKAQQILGDFEQNLSQNIKINGFYEFGAIGTFTLNDQEKLQFNPNPNTNFESSMFGLTTVSTQLPNKNPIKLVEPVLHMEETIENQVFVTEEEIEKSTKRGIKNWVYASLLFIVAAISTFVLTEPQNQNFTSSLNPFAELSNYKKTNETLQPKRVAKISSPVKVKTQVLEEAPKSEVIQKTEVNQIELVAGSFLTKEKAEKGIEELKQKGIEEAYLIEKTENQKYFRISIGAVASMEEGYEKAAEIKNEKKLDIWVFENKNK